VDADAKGFYRFMRIDAWWGQNENSICIDHFIGILPTLCVLQRAEHKPFPECKRRLRQELVSRL